jgi:amino acid transporter
VILGYLVLAPAVLATAVAYIVFLSTPLGRAPGAEYTHIARTFGAGRVAFLAAWLKLVSYMGACAFLAVAQADYLVELARLLGAALDPGRWRTPLALAGLLLFWAVNVWGVRWFGRIQVAMCSLLGLAILVLVVPGLFAIRAENYRPFFEHGGTGFLAALPALFFAYAGFESLAHTAGEVKDSTRTLPRVYLRGIVLTALIFVSMSAVTLGVLPAARIAGNPTPMAEAAAAYLPFGPTALVTLGAVLAVATSLNGSLFVPSRLMLVLADDGHLPSWLARVEPRTGTPVLGLSLTLAASAALVAAGQIQLTMTSAVLALVSLYALHSLALCLLPRANPALFAQATARVPPAWRWAAGIASVGSMLLLMASQLAADARHVRATSLAERWHGGTLTSFELVLAWTLIGLFVHALRPGQRTNA